MSEVSCLNCIHKDVCLKRGMAVFMLYIQTGRYGEVEDAQQNLDIGYECDDWEERQ